MNTPGLDASIDSLGLSVRASNALKNGGILTVGELVKRSYRDLTEITNLGKVSIAEIGQAVALAGICLEGPAPPEVALRTRGFMDDRLSVLASIDKDLDVLRRARTAVQRYNKACPQEGGGDEALLRASLLEILR